MSRQKVRELSCIGILATSGDENSPGYLWLVDATGAYRIRAHAMGGGTLGSAACNEVLRTSDFSQLSKEEGAKRLIQMLTTEQSLNLPAEARVEVATVGASPVRKVERRLASSLFGIIPSATQR